MGSGGTVAEEHALSGGVIFSFILFMFGELMNLLHTNLRSFHYVKRSIRFLFHFFKYVEKKRGQQFSFVKICFYPVVATHILTSPNKGSKGSLVGYSASGLPLYSFAGDALHKTSQSVLTTLKNGMRQILESSDSRRIFYFLCVNLVSNARSKVFPTFSGL